MDFVLLFILKCHTSEVRIKWKGAPSLQIKTLHSLGELGAGPISLLVTTTASPRSSASIALLARLEELGNMKSHKHRLAIHLLHLHANMNASPNTFLNIARLFSPTRFVMLFPVSLDNIPAPKLHEDLLSRMKSNITARDLSPTIVSFTRNSSATRFPYLRDTPLLLDRSHPIWCTERFFSVPSRSQDWDECLWLFWLKSFGGLHTLANPKWKYTLTDQSSNPVESGADSINVRSSLVFFFRIFKVNM